MKIVFFQPPGRFPTVVQDYGQCWDALGSAGFACEGYSANVRWWRRLCSPAYVDLLAARLPLRELLAEKISERATPQAVAGLAAAAGRSLDLLRAPGTYSEAAAYAAALKPFADYTRLLNYLQEEFKVTTYYGPEAQADYACSAALAAYAASDSLLAASVGGALEEFPPDAGACFFYVSSARDLLTCLMAARLLRERYPGLYLCIASHGHENFSLDGALVPESPLFGFVDSVIRRGYQKDAAAVRLALELAAGRRPLGIIDAAESEARGQGEALTQPLEAGFSPVPIFWTRLSQKRCYWSRCSFCVQNSKHAEGGVPSGADLEATVRRVEGLLARGCNQVYFWDEALPLDILEALCGAIEKRGLRFNWACRCRIDAGFSERLFSRLKAAGCYEVLFGVESVVPRVQRLMNKYGGELPEPEIRRVVDMARAAGLGIHLTFVTGFPGETATEAGATVRFAASALKDFDLATYYFNFFNLYSGSEVWRNPGKYGITAAAPGGDLPVSLPYVFNSETARLEHELLLKELPGLIAGTEKALGWSRLEARSELKLAREFYFNYGHGSIIKSSGLDLLKPFRIAGQGA